MAHWFLGNLVITREAGKHLSVFTLKEDFGFGDARYLILVKKGMVFDGNSTPRALWWFSAPFDEDAESACIHDALYQAEALPRYECDWIFLECMQANGISWWKRTAKYLAVRLFGWTAWREHTPESISKAMRYVEVKSRSMA